MGACYVTRAVVHSIVPLAVLEAVRNLDTPVEDGLSEFAEELLSKRLGLSHTVAMQLAQYETMVRRGARADSAHVEALLRLVGRRPDADLVFADAGRRAARRAVRGLSVASRLAARAAPRLLGDGAACALFGTGFAELLRLLVGFEGAMLHTACRATGGDRCEWRAAPPDPRHH